MKKQPENLFETGPQITLPGLEEKIALPPKTLFRFDPEVPSLAENLAKTELEIKELQAIPEDCSIDLLEKARRWMMVKIISAQVREKIRDIDRLAGYCFSHRISDSRQAHVIAVRSGLDYSKKIFACGHESGELITKLKQPLIMQALIDKANIDLDTGRYSGEEFADIGGMLALKKAAVRGEHVAVPAFNHRPPVLPELQKILQS